MSYLTSSNPNQKQERHHMPSIKERLTELEQRSYRLESVLSMPGAIAGDATDVATIGIELNCVIEFMYGKPLGRSTIFGISGTATDCETRQVTPLTLKTCKDGSESIVGYDHDREEFRQFKTNRIMGDVRLDFTVAPYQPEAQ